jgi:hypothetical protein
MMHEGFRALAYVEDGVARLVSRIGPDISKELEAALCATSISKVLS